MSLTTYESRVRRGDGSSVLINSKKTGGRQGDGSSVLTKPEKGDENSANDEINE